MTATTLAHIDPSFWSSMMVLHHSMPYHWVFRSPDAVVHQAAPTRAASVIRALMDGHRPLVWLSDRYSAQQGHAQAQQTCLAHLARDVRLCARGERGPAALEAGALVAI